MADKEPAISKQRVEAGIEALRRTEGAEQEKVVAIFRAMTELKTTNKSKPERPDWDG